MANDGGRKPAQRRVLLIGGAGYVGVPVARHLLASGHFVRILDRLVYRNGASLFGLVSEPDFEFVFGDMADQATL